MHLRGWLRLDRGVHLGGKHTDLVLLSHEDEVVQRAVLLVALAGRLARVLGDVVVLLLVQSVRTTRNVCTYTTAFNPNLSLSQLFGHVEYLVAPLHPELFQPGARELLEDAVLHLPKGRRC